MCIAIAPLLFGRRDYNIILLRFLFDVNGWMGCWHGHEPSRTYTGFCFTTDLRKTQYFEFVK